MRFRFICLLTTVILGLGIFPRPTYTHAQKPDTAALFTKCWQHETAGLITSLESDNSRIYVLDQGARLEAVSALSGERLWISELGGEVASNIAVGDDHIFVVTSSGPTRATLRSISSETGITNWRSEHPTRSAKIVVLHRSVISVSADGSAFANSQKDGSRQWATRFPAAISFGPVASGTKLAVGLANGSLLLLSALDGSVITQTVSKYPPKVIVFEDDHLYWGDERGNVFSYNIESRDYRWKLKQGARITGMIMTDRDLVVTSADNFVYMITRHNGSVRWKKRQSNRITAIESWPPNRLIIFDVEGESAAVIDVVSGRLINQIDAPSETFILMPTVSSYYAILPSSQRISAFGFEGCSAK